MFFDPLYLIMILPALALSIFAQIAVKRTYARYSQIGSNRGLTGAQAAREVLMRAGIHDVTIEAVDGFLSDHYDPSKKVLRLSPDVHQGRSIASIGVACHEAGHAIQHNRRFAPLVLRSMMVPMASLGSNLAFPLILIGMLMNATSLIWGGIIFFSAVVLFQIVTLPVEFDASRRAVAVMADYGILHTQELTGARKVLNAAAMTYVAAAAAAILQLIYYVMRARE